LLIGLVILASVVIPVVGAAANSPLHRMDAERFAGRQMVDVTAFNGSHILRYLQVTRRWRWMGTAAGMTALPLTMTAESFQLSPYFPVTGWLLGAMAGEIAFGRATGRVRRRLGMRLVPPALTAAWTVSAALSCGLALGTVVRSLSHDIGAAQRLGAVATLALVAIVQAMVTGLHRRALAAGPADLVGAELATRSRSARSLTGAGAAVALWTAMSVFPGRLSAEVTAVGWLLVAGLPIVAWVKSADSWQVRTSGGKHAWAPAAVALTLAATALYTGLTAEAPQPAATRRPLVVNDSDQPFPYAWIDPQAREWVVLAPNAVLGVSQAATRLPGSHRRAPFALSGDGKRVVYLDEETRGLFLHDFSPSGATRQLTGPLPVAAFPEVTMSHDGRYVSIGAEVIDTATWSRFSLPGAGNVLGFGSGRVVATTGRRALPGAPDTELLTLDLHGTVRTRVPFDPTLEVLPTPDGRVLAVVTGDELLTMDPATGKVRERVKLRLPAHYGSPEALSWAHDGRLLVKVDPEEDDDDAFHLVDPRTGKSRPVTGMPDRPDDLVFGRLR
jgi:hypothetical protein